MIRPLDNSFAASYYDGLAAVRHPATVELGVTELNIGMVGKTGAGSGLYANASVLLPMGPMVNRYVLGAVPLRRSGSNPPFLWKRCGSAVLPVVGHSAGSPELAGGPAVLHCDCFHRHGKALRFHGTRSLRTSGPIHAREYGKALKETRSSLLAPEQARCIGFRASFAAFSGPSSKPPPETAQQFQVDL